ncbi:hypothetical protein K7432_012695 [Basidiobolus ranarum]|uniref:KOW domain-containing protein n=1 Tax=Basidiobolus ranarum TaxID=34480 RepID=A0ABR2WKJ0_9FUNG
MPRNLMRLSSRILPKEHWVNPRDLLKTWNLVKGDEVMIVTGKDKGETGRIAQVLRKNNSVVVAEKNLVWNHVRMSESTPSGKVQKEMPIHISNVALLDPNTRRPTKIDMRKLPDSESGKLQWRRFAAGTNTEIPKPVYLEYKENRKDGPFDTEPDAVAEVTYTPTLASPPFPETVIGELTDLRSKRNRNRKKATFKV